MIIFIKQTTTKLIFMKKLLLLMLAAFALNVNAQNKLIQSKILSFEAVKGKKKKLGIEKSINVKLDSIYDYKWDTLNLEWINKNRTIEMTYDINDNLLGSVTQDWNGLSWINESKLTNTYTIDIIANTLIQKWNGATWEDSLQCIYSYDSSNNLLTEMYQEWNGISWNNLSQTINTYDINNNLTSIIYQDGNGSSWDNSGQELYTYDINNKLITNSYNYWDGVSWNNDFLANHLYTINNLDSITIGSLWDGISYIEYELDTYLYDVNNNLIYLSFQNYDGVTASNSVQTFYTYDGYNNNIEITQEIVDNADNNWKTWLKGYHTIDGNNVKINDKYNFYNMSPNIERGDSIQYYYHFNTDVIEEIKNEVVNLVYPNPSEGVFFIESSKNRLTIEISNVLGEKVYFEKSLNNDNGAIKKIDLSNSKKGIYFVQIDNGIRKENIRIIIQ